MSRGTKLQEMEQTKTAVTANATPGDAAMPTAGSNASGVTVDKKQLDENKLNIFNDFLNSL